MSGSQDCAHIDIASQTHPRGASGRHGLSFWRQQPPFPRPVSDARALRSERRAIGNPNARRLYRWHQRSPRAAVVRSPWPGSTPTTSLARLARRPVKTFPTVVHTHLRRAHRGCWRAAYSRGHLTRLRPHPTLTCIIGIAVLAVNFDSGSDCNNGGQAGVNSGKGLSQPRPGAPSTCRPTRLMVVQGALAQMDNRFEL
jgi:hypothetical protein